MKRFLAILLALIMVCALFAGCGASSTEPADSGKPAASGKPADSGKPAASSSASATATTPADATDKTVYISLGDGDPGTLDPFSTTGSAFWQATMQLYDRLMEYDKDGQLVSDLAESYDRKGNTLTFHLYDNIYDTAGNHFTAADAVWCLEKFHEKGDTYVTEFTAPTYVDDTTFTVELVNESVTTMSQLKYLPMVTKAAYEAAGENMATSVVSTGPYKLVEYVTGSSITLEKNENYWQTDEKKSAAIQMQNADKIVYNLMTEASQIAINLETNAVDFAFLDWTVADRFTSGEVNGNFLATEVQTWGGNDLFFNMSDKSIFKDNANLRKAIYYAIDNQAIVDVVWDGHAQNPKSYGNYNYPDANPAWQNENYFDYDPVLAQQYMDASGYKAGELTLRLIFQSSSYTNNMAELVQAYLGVIGINVDIQALDNAIYTEYFNDPTRFDIAFAGGGGDGSITRIWGKRINKNAFSGDYCNGFLNDDHLQELVEAACDPATHSRETVDAVHYYLIDNAYVMRLYIEYKCVVSNADKVVEPFVNSDARPVPGAFTYVWNT